MGPHPVRCWLSRTLSFGFQESEKLSDRDDFDRLNPVKTQEIVVSADKPAYSCRCRAGDELGIVWVSNIGNSCWDDFDGLYKGEEFLFDHTSDLSRREFKLGIGQHSNVFIKYGG